MLVVQLEMEKAVITFDQKDIQSFDNGLSLKELVSLYLQLISWVRHFYYKACPLKKFRYSDATNVTVDPYKQTTI